MHKKCRPGDRAVTQPLEAIDALIREGQYDRARAMIADARQSLPADQLHHLTALSAAIERKCGNLSAGIDLYRQAIREAPTWLPYWYFLGVCLMDDELWLEALETINKVIALCEQTGDHYVLNDAKFRKLFCLKALGRDDEIGSHKHDIPADSFIVGGDGTLYTLDDLA